MTPNPNSEPVEHVDSLRYAAEASLQHDPVQADVSDELGGLAAPTQGRLGVVASGHGVSVLRRAHVEKAIQHGVPRDAALRFEALTQGWIERITG